MYFYEVLQEIMEEKSLSIPDVARMSNLTDSTVRSIINRKNKTVALEVAFKLAKGLNVPLERLNGEKPIESFCINDNEKKIIVAYRNHPEVQFAIDKLLDIGTDKSKRE